MRLALAVALAVALAGAAPAAAEPIALGPAERDVVEVSPPPGARVTRVTVDNRYGDVTIVGHDRAEVAVEARKRAADPAVIERLKVQLVPAPDGAVTITALLKAGDEERPIPAGSARIDLVVKVPRDAHVAARLWHGRVEVARTDRGAELAVHRGDIVVRTVSGAVTTESSFGDQRFEEISGVLEAHAIEGALRLARIRGERLAATVYRGRIDGEQVRSRELAIEIARGDVRLALEPVAGGTYRVAAWQGDLVLTVGRKVPVRLTARAGGRLEMPRRMRASRGGAAGETIGYLGSGATPAVLDLSTRTGNLTVAEF